MFIVLGCIGGPLFTCCGTRVPPSDEPARPEQSVVEPGRTLQSTMMQRRSAIDPAALVG